MQTNCDLIIMYFDPKTDSPITLLELGKFCDSGRIVVTCQKPFWKKGNVDVVCEKYGVPMAKSLDALIEYAKIKYLEKYKK